MRIRKPMAVSATWFAHASPGRLEGRGTVLATAVRVTAPPTKLLDRVREAIRMRHYSRRTEEVYVAWIRRYILHHRKKHPADMSAPEVSAFLASLVNEGAVSASTQNQALSALVFLYRHVLHAPLGPVEMPPRAQMPSRLPVVLSREEVGRVLACLDGVMWIVAALLYGAGLRLQECLELRVKDLDFDRRQIVVRRGKGQKDRVTMLPGVVVDRLNAHLAHVRQLHETDLARGLGRVVLPFALDRKYRTPRLSGAGSSCFPPRGFVEIRGTGRQRVTTCMSLWCSARCRPLPGRPA